VLVRADFPIIGEGDAEPNDTFVKQLVANGKAAIDEMDRRGIVDPQRVGVGGHSYGAFMTANLLAHSDLFAAGIARSGAYNRTLTPFGFQREERTFWEAPEIYFAMSPFMHAHKVNEPILLIHGIADNNSGTFPMQSERYYNALKGHGATARLVMLPAESHGYRAKESIMHMLWEMDSWLEKYVKNKDKLGESKEKIEVNK
jgi:dipeptidyl aminopeptidase/acylaminoacyl peptidase